MMQQRLARVRPLVSVDFTALSNGALPPLFAGATFTIASGLVMNTPTVGAELLTDPGLEATYTAGKCNTLTATGSPTVAESADVHGGSKAQSFTAVAQSNALSFNSLTPTAGAWYLYSFWGKRATGSGTNQRSQVTTTNNMRPQASTSAMIFNGTSYTQRRTSFITNSTTSLAVTAMLDVGTSSFNTILGDDYSLKRLTYVDLFAILPAAQANVIVRVVPAAIADQSLSGIVARSDAQASPAAALFAFYRWVGVESGSLNVSLVELAGGVYTTLIAETAVTETAGAALELRVIGTTATLLYNNAPVGTPQTVAASGAFHGMCITGNNKIRQFQLARAA